MKRHESARDILKATQFHYRKMFESVPNGDIEVFQNYAMATIVLARSIYHIIDSSKRNQQLGNWWKNKKDELEKDQEYVYLRDKRDTILKEGNSGLDKKNFKYQIHSEYISKEGDAKIEPILHARIENGKVSPKLMDKLSGKEVEAKFAVHYQYFFADRNDELAINLIWEFMVKLETLLGEYENEARKYTNIEY